MGVTELHVIPERHVLQKATISDFNIVLYLLPNVILTSFDAALKKSFDPTTATMSTALADQSKPCAGSLSNATTWKFER